MTEPKRSAAAGQVLPRRGERRQTIYARTRPFLSSEGLIQIERRTHGDRRQSAQPGNLQTCALLRKRTGIRDDEEPTRRWLSLFRPLPRVLHQVSRLLGNSWRHP